MRQTMCDRTRQTCATMKGSSPKNLLLHNPFVKAQQWQRPGAPGHAIDPLAFKGDEADDRERRSLAVPLHLAHHVASALVARQLR